ncbi:MAG: alpha/beta hydrolase [Bacteroidales bacterium]|nr:alpha/beta hydrolase [Bacteroidales bacterium]
MYGSILYKGKKISFVDRGEGNALVLLHGFLENMSMWDYFSQKLSEEFRVITIDLPGFGGSECINSVHLMEQMAAVVNEVLEHLEVEKCLMIGHSMGGYVTLAFVDKFPEKLQGFGLFHSHALADSPDAKRNRNRAIDIVKADCGSFIYNFIPDLFAPENVESFEKEIKKLYEDAMNTSPKAIIAALEGMKNRTDKRDVLAYAKVPVLFILGKKDSRIPIEKTLVQASLPAVSEILVLDDAGHMGHIEAPKETLGAVRGFAKKVF